MSLFSYVKVMNTPVYFLNRDESYQHPTIQTVDGFPLFGQLYDTTKFLDIVKRTLYRRIKDLVVNSTKGQYNNAYTTIGFNNNNRRILRRGVQNDVYVTWEGYNDFEFYLLSKIICEEVDVVPL